MINFVSNFVVFVETDSQNDKLFGRQMTSESYLALLGALEKSESHVHDWIRAHVANSTLASKYCFYISEIMKKKYVRYKDFRIGTVITSSSEQTWKVTAKRGKIETDPYFNPHFTPDEMLRLGVFGGVYIKGMESEIPIEWILMALVQHTINVESDQPSADYNCYKVISVQNIEEWRRNGWIYDADPLGWFQWYIRYFLGRRCDDDTRQRNRWYSFRRHLGQIRANPGQSRLSQRQACIQWAYNPSL